MTSDISQDRATSVSILRRLVQEHGRDHVWAYAGAAVLLTLAAGATALSAYLLKPVVNGMVAGTDFKQLRMLAWVVAGLFTARGIVTFLSILILARTGNRIVANVQRRLFDHLALALRARQQRGQHRVGEVRRAGLPGQPVVPQWVF